MSLRQSIAALALLVLPLAADPGHEIQIEDLTKQIALNPGQPDLYYQRAINFRESNRPAEARADLSKAAELAPGFLPAGRELAQLDANEGKLAGGIGRLRQLIESAPAESAFYLPDCYAVLTDLLLRDNKDAEALSAAQKGIELSTQFTLDLYLFRAEAQRRLGRHQDRVKDLAEAKEKLKSFVLFALWVDALIDAGQTAEAIPVIDKQLETLRLKSTWLIRRARAYLVEKRTAEAEADLTAALTEIDSRLRPEQPDVSLLCDKALIHALQGNKDLARTELADAKTRGAVPWMTRNAEAALAK